MSILIHDAQIAAMDTRTGSEPFTGSIRVSGSEIVEIGSELRPQPGERVIDGRDRLVTPGFVNAHTHSWETLYKGRYDNLPLELWMLYAYPILGADPLTPELIRLRSLVFANEAMKSGVTTIVDDVLENPSQDAAQLEAVFSAYRDIGIRANISGHVINVPFVDTLPFVSDWLPRDLLAKVRSAPLSSADEYLAFSADAFARYHGTADRRLRYMLAPSAPQRCTPELLAGATELAALHGAEMHIHVLETKNQLVTADEFFGRTMVEYLDTIGALSRNTTISHGIWLADRDIDLVAGSGASIAHNPISNLKLGSGIAPWRRLRDAGITLGLGTDGWSSSDTPRMLEVIKMTALLHKVTDFDYENWPAVQEVLHAATLGGARTAMLDDITGSIEVGKKADLLVFDLRTLNFTPQQRLDHQLVYSENGSSLEYVMVDGVVTVEQGRLTTMDEDDILEEFRARMPDIRRWQERTDRLNAAFMPAFAQMHRRSAATDAPVHRMAGPFPFAPAY